MSTVQGTHARSTAARGVAWLAAAVALLAPRVDARDTETPVAERLASAEPGLDVRALGEQLAALGTVALPELFDGLRDGRLPLATPEGDETLALLPEWTSAIQVAFGALPGSAVRTFLRERTAEEPTLEDLRTALRVLAPIARRDDLGFCLDLATPESSATPVDDVSAASLQACLETILRDSELAFSAMRQAFVESRVELRLSIVRALTAVGTEPGLRALSELVGLCAPLDSFVLSSMGRVATSVALPVDRPILERVRKFAADDRAGLVREALLLLGRFEDADSVPRMIAQLEHEDRGVVQAAHWALKHLSGLGMREDPQRWILWHEGERTWWRTESPAALAALRSREVAERKHGIAVLSRRRLHRHEIAAALVRVLDDPDDGVVVHAVRALELLGSRHVADELEDLLDHPSEAVRASAAAALGELRPAAARN